VVLWGRGLVVLALLAFLVLHATGDVPAQRILLDWIIPAMAVVIIGLGVSWQRRNQPGNGPSKNGPSRN
jgi:hypothetical protein